MRIAIVTVLASAALLSAAVWAHCGACGVAGAKKGTAGSGCSAKGACAVSTQKSCCGTCQTKGACTAKAGAAKHAHGEYATVTTEALKALITSKANVVVLDARSGKWDDGQRIPGAKSLAAGAEASEVAKHIPTKDSLVVTYCSNTKCPASAKLAKHLHQLGYTNILKYPVGLEGWIGSGNDVEKVN